MKAFKLFLATVVALFVVGLATAAQKPDTSAPQAVDANGNLNLSVDPYFKGGLDKAKAELLLAHYHKQHPEVSCDDAIAYAFNQKIKMTAYFFKNGKKYPVTGWLLPGRKMLGPVLSRVAKNGGWEVDVLFLFLWDCGNPMVGSLRMTLWIPKWGGDVVFVKGVNKVTTVPEKFAIPGETIAQPGDVNITAPPAERPGMKLTEIGHESAGRLWNANSSFWDIAAKMLGAVAAPLAEIFHKAPSISLNNSSSSDSSSSSSSSASASASAAASAAAAAAAGGGSAPEPLPEPMALIVVFVNRTFDVGRYDPFSTLPRLVVYL